jgi:hypothetical protein
MARRPWSRVTKGQPYVVEWPEYHVECANAACDARALLTHTGEASTRKEAERHVKARGFAHGGDGWTKRHGLWYCPAHA